MRRALVRINLKREAANTIAVQIALRRCLCYYLTVSCDETQYFLTLQSVRHVKRAFATVSGQRRPDVSAMPLGSKYSTFK